MSKLHEGPENEDSFRPFTKAEHIKQLNDIDKSVTQLLHSAGLAIQVLSVSKSTSDLSPADQREAFKAASNSYLKTLQSVDIRLRRQIYGLEEADIIPAEKAKGKKVDGQDSYPGMEVPKSGANVLSFGSNTAVPTTAAAAEGGMGKLDIGWLNSRSGRVERHMEAELWAKSLKFLEGLENGTSKGVSTSVDGADEDKMEV
ncbi:hypothetical protein B7494_g2600 [Chlorociboria aeruginascens]|nr:hypothetical protein B7494_g2600 [Chlorociboria aeruginascens]